MFVSQRLLQFYLEAVKKYCGKWDVGEENVTYYSKIAEVQKLKKSRARGFVILFYCDG